MKILTLKKECDVMNQRLQTLGAVLLLLFCIFLVKFLIKVFQS